MPMLLWTDRLPTEGFANITEARKWVLTFTQWYNHEHCHSGLNFITPQQRHTGKDEEIFENRRRVYEKAKAVHPERWSGEIRDWSLEDEVWLNPERSQNDISKQKQIS
jgi:putative transposase